MLHRATVALLAVFFLAACNGNPQPSEKPPSKPGSDSGELNPIGGGGGQGGFGAGQQGGGGQFGGGQFGGGQFGGGQFGGNNFGDLTPDRMPDDPFAVAALREAGAIILPVFANRWNFLQPRQAPGLFFIHKPVKEVDFSRLKGFYGLRSISMFRCNVTDDDLVYFKHMRRLNVLNLAGNKITDAGLVHLEGMTHLKSLNLGLTQVTPSGVEKLQKALPDTKIEHN